MNTINDGGFAFPVWELNGNGQPEMTGFGLSARDYFAAKAMQGLLAARGRYENYREIASDAYLLADAMLKARENQT